MYLKSIAKIGLCFFTATTAKYLRQGDVNSFFYRDYGEIVNYLHELEAAYPEFVELYTTEEEYGLEMPQEFQCRRDGESELCRQYVLRITDQTTLPDASRPQVFFSGAVHGNERVGPNVVIEYAALILDHASREDGNPWLKHLVATRDIYIMPTTNPYGYFKNSRQENMIDPNRDFNYLKSGSCMNTITARGVNELWRRQLFQVAITFHAGVASITYEWGSKNHATGSTGWGFSGPSEISPDDIAQHDLAIAMSRYGGVFGDFSYYETGRMNDELYATEGGMEDWAYAGSWENEVTSDDRTPPLGICDPETYGGYDLAQTQYNDATHRALNILVETSTAKEPLEPHLGDDAVLSDTKLSSYLSKTEKVGHVPRNIRLALLYTDLAQPYINWHSTPELNLISAGETLDLEWEVAGAIMIDSTALQYSTFSSFDEDDIQTTATQSGVSRWYHKDIDDSKALDNAMDSTDGKFKASLSFERPGTYFVRAVAVVDQNWAGQPETPTPNVPPQTHYVNARTNEDWYYENNGFVVQGQREWFSDVIEIQVD